MGDDKKKKKKLSAYELNEKAKKARKRVEKRKVKSYAEEEKAKKPSQKGKTTSVTYIEDWLVHKDGARTRSKAYKPKGKQATTRPNERVRAEAKKKQWEAAKKKKKK